jgi:hypothetical protein
MVIVCLARLERLEAGLMRKEDEKSERSGKIGILRVGWCNAEQDGQWA